MCQNDIFNERADENALSLVVFFFFLGVILIFNLK